MGNDGLKNWTFHPVFKPVFDKFDEFESKKKKEKDALYEKYINDVGPGKAVNHLDAYLKYRIARKAGEKILFEEDAEEDDSM